MGCDNGDSNEPVAETESSSSINWPGLDRAAWREVILHFYGYGAPYDYDRHADSLVQGKPVSNAQLDELEVRIGLPLPPGFREFYGKQNGFGLRQENGSIDWVFVPIEDIPALTGKSREWIQEIHPELAPQILAFVDWDDGVSAGFVFSESVAPLGCVVGFHRDHDGTFGDPGEVSIYNLLTEPNVPPRFIAKKNLGEQDGADQPATAPESTPEGKGKPQHESEVRPQ